MSNLLLEVFTANGRVERELKNFEEITPLIRAQFALLESFDSQNLEKWIIHKQELIGSGLLTVNAVIDELVSLVERQITPTVIEDVD
jgi:hypothetical protein